MEIASGLDTEPLNAEENVSMGFGPFSGVEVVVTVKQRILSQVYIPCILDDWSNGVMCSVESLGCTQLRLSDLVFGNTLSISLLCASSGQAIADTVPVTGRLKEKLKEQSCGGCLA